MSDVVYRANLKAASFPFLSELFGRSVIIKGQDQTAPIGKVEAGTTDNSGQGIPQIYYCHNVVPTDSGYRSVGYTPTIAAIGTSTFVKVVTIQNSTGARADLAIDAAGNLYVREHGTAIWVTGLTGAPAAGTISGKRMTAAFVSGTSYIYFATVGCYSYDFSTNQFSAETFSYDAPTTDADVLGVATNRGYLIAYTTDLLLWSSLVDPTDLVASLATGAGGGLLEAARGAIRTVESVYGGMIVFTASNAVSAIASDNTRFPYNFLEINGCGGLSDPEFVSYEGNSNTVYAYTTSGLQAVSVKGAQVVFPEVTDFLSGNLLEDYDEGTDTLSLTSAGGATLQKRIAVIASRYLIISYGISALTHALFYDLAYKQWGRLKVSHVDCFEYLDTTNEVPKKSVAFLASNGAVTLLDTDIGSTTASGVMLLGKFQYARSRLLTLQGVELENINAGDTFNLLDLPAADGKNFGTAVTGYLAASSGKFRGYSFRTTALNHTLVLKGAWNAVSVVLTFTIHGAR